MNAKLLKKKTKLFYKFMVFIEENEKEIIEIKNKYQKLFEYL